MRIDVHTHAFHPQIAHKVLAQLEAHYAIHPVGLGTAEDLLIHMRRADLDKAVVLCAATNPAQVIPANAYAIELQRSYPELIAFGTIHPGFADWDAQLASLKAAGIPGLKLHPDFQGFWLNDPRLLPMFEAAQDDFIFMVHIGDRLPPQQNPSCPYKLAAILDEFPRLRVIGAHLGGYMQWEHSLKALAGRDVWLDTSSCMDAIGTVELHAILRVHPRERLLFGSDYPLFDPLVEYRRLQQRARFSDADMDALLSNARHLFV